MAVTEPIPRLARARRRLPSRPPSSLERVSIEGLFGRLNYRNIEFAKRSEHGPVTVLFGENGAGKTTLLRLIYACLSPEPNAGLRSYLGRTPFLTLMVRLTDQTEINVRKAALVGDYSFSIRSVNKNDSFDIKTDDDGDVKRQDAVIALENRLKDLELDILFIDHQRNIRSTYEFLSDAMSSRTEQVQSWLHRAEEMRHYQLQTKGYFRPTEPLINFPLEEIVIAVNEWFRDQAFRQGRTGEQDASAVYLEITRELIRRRTKSSSTEDLPTDLVAFLGTLDELTTSYVRHGLLSKYPFAELSVLYSSASVAKQDQIRVVLKPFLNSVQRRINSLSGVHNIITMFEDELNKYLTRKVSLFHILNGLVLRDQLTEQPIQLDSLSSGEKQLVFILCAAIISRSARSLILIDEPELSLNYKWQRMIAGSLARMSMNSNTQYVLASHSIEIISRYENSAVELEST